MGVQRQEQLQADRVKMRLARRLAQATQSGSAPVHPGLVPAAGARPLPPGFAQQTRTLKGYARVGGQGRPTGPLPLDEFQGRLSDPDADLVRGGTSEERGLARRRQRETLAPTTKGAEYGTEMLKTGGISDPAVIKALLAKQFIGGDIISGGDKATRRLQRDRLRYSRAAAGL